MYIFGHLLCWNLKPKLQDGQNETGKVNQLDVGNKKDHSGVARAFPGGRHAHPEGQNEEENEKSLRKSKKTWSKFEEKMRKVELLAPPGTVRLAMTLKDHHN